MCSSDLEVSNSTVAAVLTVLGYSIYDTIIIFDRIRENAPIMAKLDVLFNRLVIALVVTGGLIGSSLIGIFAKSGPHVLGLHVISVLGFSLSAILGVWLLWSVVRSGRI